MNMLCRLAALVMVAVVSVQGVAATEPDSLFDNATIRFDYVLGGTALKPTASLAATSRTSGWAGRHRRLARMPLRGNGSLTAVSLNGDTLYATSFSTLYNEWLSTGDSVSRAYQMSVRIPQPKMPADIRMRIYDRTGNTIIDHVHRFVPTDILIRHPRNPGYDTVTVHRGAYTGNKIRVAVLPEGFRADQMDVFHDYAGRAVRAILAHEPFASLADYFDFVAVDVPSHDSGVSVPKRGVWKDTAFRSHFSTFYSDRYLTTPNVFDIHDALVGVPYEHIIILANTDVYGGGGIYNSYTLTTTGNPQFEPVVVHEFGHSFGGLADEYFYENDSMSDSYDLETEPWEPNITTLVDFDSKWKHLLPAGTPVPTPVSEADCYPVGVYEGGGYVFHGVYRPADHCRMRDNKTPAFCPACQEALRKLILFYID